MVHFTLKRMVPVRSSEQEEPTRRQCTHRLEYRSTPIGHMLQEGIKNNYIELPDISGKTCCVGYDPSEHLGISQTLATLGACNKFRIKINAGDLAAARCPVNAPRTRSTSDI